jgi:glucose 1-dehydrogenase
MSLDGRVAVVTGGARGIGQATAAELARSGADVVFCDICKQEQAEETLALIRGFQRRAQFIRADVGNRSEVDEMFRQIVNEFGQIDILVNNAATNTRKPLLELAIEDVQRVWSVALWGVFHCSQVAAREMARRQKGSIIVISSVHAVQPFPNNTAYNGAKAAVNQMARTWAAELIGAGIRVNVVEPGWTDTPGERTLYSEEQIQQEGSKLPMGRLASASEIANAVRFLVSDDAAYITGTCVRVDGGLLLPRVSGGSN